MNIDDLGYSEASYAAVAGVAHVLLIRFVFNDGGYTVSTPVDGLLLLYVYGGMFVLSAVPALLFVRDIYLPVAGVGVCFGLTAYWEWQLQAATAPQLPPTPIFVYTLGWPLLLSLLLVFGGVEVRLRGYQSRTID